MGRKRREAEEKRGGGASGGPGALYTLKGWIKSQHQKKWRGGLKEGRGRSDHTGIHSGFPFVSVCVRVNVHVWGAKEGVASLGDGVTSISKMPNILHGCCICTLLLTTQPSPPLHDAEILDFKGNGTFLSLT